MINRSFVEAFEDRYLDNGDLNDEDLKIKGKQRYTKDLVVELVGKSKAIDTFKQLNNLTQIVLSNCAIECCDPSNPLKLSVDSSNLRLAISKNTSIRSLDISCNQINSWIEIVRIVSLFPYLEELIISDNPLKSVDDLIDQDLFEYQIDKLKGIKHLVAGHLNVGWFSVELFDKLFINLRALDIFDNKLIGVVLGNSSSFQNLEYVSLSDNQLDWSDLLKILTQLRNLKHLLIENCGIERILIDEKLPLTKLQRLNLAANKLKEWSDISELAKLPNLTDLIIQRNPLFENQDYDRVFAFALAILKNVKSLNRQIITNEKRKEAEIYFLRTNFKAWSCGDLKDWKIDNRLKELIELYGEPVDLLNNIHLNKFVCINLKYDDKTLKKKLLKSMSVITLRTLVQRLFGLDNDVQFDLWYLNNDSSLSFKIDHDNKLLDFYPLNDDCTLQIVSR